MICSKCGKELSEDAKFCEFCGAARIDVPGSESEFVPETAAIIPESPELHNAPEIPDIPAIPETAAIIPESPELHNALEIPDIPAIPESPIIGNENVSNPFVVEIPEEPPLVNTEVKPSSSLSDRIRGGAKRIPGLAESVWARVLETAKKLGKVKLISIGAGAVVIVVGAVFALNFAFDRAGFIHAFSGNKKYALSMMSRDAFGNTAIAVLSGNSPLTGVVPADGVTVKVNADTNLPAFESAEMNENLTALNSLTAVLGFKPNGANLYGSVQITENSEELARADMLLTDGRLYFAAPDTAPLYTETDYNTSPDNSFALSEISEKAEFAFGSPDIGGFNGKMMTVSLRGQVIKELTSVDFAESAVLTIKYYINNDNTLAGGRYTLVSDSDEAELFWLDNPKSGFSMSAKNSDSELKVLQEKTSETAGRLVITRNSGSSRTFVVDYTDFERKNLFGKELILGKFTCANLGGEFKIGKAVLDSIAVELRDDGGSLGVTANISAEDATLSANVKITSGFVPSEIDTTDARNTDALESGDWEEIFTSVAGHYLSVWKSDGFLNSATFDGKPFAEIIQTSYNRINRENLVKQNYADYNEDTIDESNIYARRIYLTTGIYSDEITLINPEPTVVRMYFDRNGGFSVIENNALSDNIINSISKMEMKSAYVEVTLRKGEKNGGLCGVLVVRTDDKTNTPIGCPEVYNYLDMEFPWGDNDSVGCIGEFAAGTYPLMENTPDGKEGATETADKQRVSKVSEYDKIAENTLSAFKKFVADNRFTIGSGGDRTIMFIVDKDGDWDLTTTLPGLLGSEYELDKYMGAQIPDVNNKFVYVYIDKRGDAVGVSVSDKAVPLSVPIFTVGETTQWSFCEGFWNGNPVGTYPKLRGFDGTFSDKVLSAMKGEWVQGDNLIRLDDEDFERVKALIPYSGYVSVTLADDSTYLFDLDGMMINRDMGVFRKN